MKRLWFLDFIFLILFIVSILFLISYVIVIFNSLWTLTWFGFLLGIFSIIVMILTGDYLIDELIDKMYF